MVLEDVRRLWSCYRSWRDDAKVSGGNDWECPTGNVTLIRFNDSWQITTNQLIRHRRSVDLTVNLPHVCLISVWNLRILEICHVLNASPTPAALVKPCHTESGSYSGQGILSNRSDGSLVRCARSPTGRIWLLNPECDRVWSGLLIWCERVASGESAQTQLRRPEEEAVSSEYFRICKNRLWTSISLEANLFVAFGNRNIRHQCPCTSRQLIGAPCPSIVLTDKVHSRTCLYPLVERKLYGFQKL